MAAAAGVSWKVRFGEQVVEVDDMCSKVPGLIAAAKARLGARLLPGNAAEGRAKIKLAEESLSKASADLDYAFSVMAATSEVTRSALDDLDPPRRSAIGKLRSAGELAINVIATVERCRKNLTAAVVLLDYPGILVIDTQIDFQRESCTKSLAIALEKADDIARLTAEARSDVTCVDQETTEWPAIGLDR